MMLDETQHTSIYQSSQCTTDIITAYLKNGSVSFREALDGRHELIDNLHHARTAPCRERLGAHRVCH